MLERTIKYNEPITVTTKNGNAVILSEEDYKNIMETLYIESIPEMKEGIVKAINEPADEYVDEKEVKW